MSERETDFIIDKIKTSGGRNVLAIIRKNIADADAPALIGEARAALAEADRLEAAYTDAISPNGELTREHVEHRARTEPRPDWCGKCIELTRLTDEPKPRHCPDCHPIEVARSALTAIRDQRRRERP